MERESIESREILSVKNLEVIYKTDLETVYAVNNVSFSINKGETLGIIGETGAGKTTTALSILRLLPQNTGQILNGDIIFDGINILAASQQEMRDIRGRKISMIFQDPMTSLNPVLTVGEQIAEGLIFHNKDHDKKKVDSRVDEILEMVGIPHVRKNEYPHQFSGGMKQRVVIAMALVCEPDLLIADEPTTALDVTIQAQVLKMMRQLRDRLNTSMILITHDFGVVAQMCDKVAVMYGGRIVEYGSARDIFLGEYHHPYTEGLFNCIPVINRAQNRLEPIPGLMPDPTVQYEGCSFVPRCAYSTEQCKKVKPAYYESNGHSILCHYAKRGHQE
jgi:peptide/nickel transport system ATP-binding protein